MIGDGGNSLSDYLSFKYNKVRTLETEIDVSPEKIESSSVFETVSVIQKSMSGYVVQNVLINAKEKVVCAGEYNRSLDLVNYINPGDGTATVRRVSSDVERTEEMYVEQFRDTQNKVNLYNKKNAKCIVTISRGRYAFEGICYHDVSEYVVLGQKTFCTLKEVSGERYLNDNDYKKNIISLECEIIKADEKIQYPSYIENYLGLYTGKNVDSLIAEVHRREAAFKKLYCVDLLELEKRRVFVMCVKELFFFYLGLKYIVDFNENFNLSMDERLRIEEFVKFNSLLDIEESMKNAVTFVKSFDERFDEACVEKSLREIKTKLDFVKPIAETEPINIGWHYKKVLPLIEEICLNNSSNEIPPFENRFERETRYIGVVKDIERYYFRVDLFIKNTDQSIIELGKNRFENHHYASSNTTWFYGGVNRSDAYFLDDALPAKGSVHISKISNSYVNDIRRHVGECEYVELYFLRGGRRYGRYEFTMIKPE